MKNGEVITTKDLQDTLKAAGVRINEGDAVFIRTGHGKLWMKDNQTYGDG